MAFSAVFARVLQNRACQENGTCFGPRDDDRQDRAIISATDPTRPLETFLVLITAAS
jgi:hypothetical protein